MPYGPFLQGMDLFYREIRLKSALGKKKREKKKIIKQSAIFCSWGFHLSIQKCQSNPLDGQKMPYGPFLQGMDLFFTGKSALNRR